MPNSSNAKLQYEADAVITSMVELTDQGDKTDFRSAAALWSGRAGKAPDIKPNGLKSGGAITPEVGATNDEVDIAESKCFIAGVETTISASAGEAIIRPVAEDYQIFSITVTAVGAYAVVDGAEGTSFSETRGGNGGPPFIDNDAIEIGQIRVSSQTPAVITTDEIKQVENVHLERYDLPNWEVEYASVENGILGFAGIVFHSALPAIHSEDAGSTTFGKDVYAEYYTPSFVEIVDAYDYSPPAQSHSINTTQVYGRVKGSASQALNAGAFSVELKDGITDNLLRFVDEFIWFKFFQDRLNDPYILTQGYLGAPVQFPAGANVNATCSIAAETVAVRVND
jgi:hypothetical protein